MKKLQWPGRCVWKFYAFLFLIFLGSNSKSSDSKCWKFSELRVRCSRSETPVLVKLADRSMPGNVCFPGGVVGHKIDTYVRPAAKKLDQVRWKFLMKNGGRSGGKLWKKGKVRWKIMPKNTLFHIRINKFAYILGFLTILYIGLLILVKNWSEFTKNWAKL